MSKILLPNLDPTKVTMASKLKLAYEKVFNMLDAIVEMNKAKVIEEVATSYKLEVSELLIFVDLNHANE